MNIETSIELLRSLILTSFMLIAPLLGVAIAVGLVVSIFQTVTSIQEQTLTFVPKLVAVGFTLMLISSWMLRGVMDFTITLFQSVADMGP